MFLRKKQYQLLDIAFLIFIRLKIFDY